MITGDIDTTYHTVQRDFFASGLAAKIGANSFAIWSAIKVHADFENGKAWPSVRKLAEMTGLGNATVMRCIETLEESHLLRKDKKGWPSNPTKGTRGRTHTYVARERLDVKIGNRVLCTIVVDYVPFQVHKRLAAIKGALADPSKGSDDLWAQVDIVPGDGFHWDSDRKVLTSQIPAKDIPATSSGSVNSTQAVKEHLKAIADEMTGKVPKK